jgi:(methylthio)acryloyl-CoA hydratase
LVKADTVPVCEFMKIELAADVAVIILDRADKRNALSAAFIEEICALFGWVRRTEAVRAVVVKAEGSVFCAGLDLIEHHLEDRSATDFMYICRRWHAAFDAI